jgi:hypothetical protein
MTGTPNRALHDGGAEQPQGENTGPTTGPITGQITEQMLGRAVIEATAAGIQQGRLQGMAEGARAERERIAAVRAQALPGHEALIEQLAADGKTTGPEAATAVLAAERQLRATAATAHRADAPAAAPAALAPGAVGTASGSAASDDRSLGKQAAALFNTLKGHAQ